MNEKENDIYTIAKNLLDETLKLFYSQDSILFDYKNIEKSIAERCMVFRIGVYMYTLMINSGLFPESTLDCEYNRNFDHPKGMYDDVAKKVVNIIPDLIIHKRKDKENNIVCMEFKKGSPKDEQELHDLKKLEYLTNPQKEYKYRVGFYVVLYRKRAKIKVYQHGRHKSHIDWEFEDK